MSMPPATTLRVTGVPDDANGPSHHHRDFPLTFTVTAVVAFDTAIVPTGRYGLEPTVLLSSPFTRTSAAQWLSFGDQAAVRIRPGASTAAFLGAAQRLAKQYPSTAGQLNVVSLAGQVAATERAIRPQAIALAAFAALAGLIALAVIGQLLSRQLTMDAAQYPVLRAIGATRGQLVAQSLAQVALVTAGGAVTAFGIAVAASPSMPLGPARLAEPAPGVEVNLAILAAGAVVIALLPLALVAPAAWRAAGQPGGPLGQAAPAVSRRSRLSRLGTALGMAGSVPGSVGVPPAGRAGALPLDDGDGS